MKTSLKKILLAGSVILALFLAVHFSSLNCLFSAQPNTQETVAAEAAAVYYDASVFPLPITHYTQRHPAAANSYLIWHRIPNAVYYEIELLSGPPEEEHTIYLSQTQHLFSTKSVYTNGWQADFTPYLNEPVLYWRVRALDYFDHPIGAFSKAERLYIDPEAAEPEKPLLNIYDRPKIPTQPLYPVYDWIPMHDPEVQYEVELLSAPPEEENNTKPSIHRIWHSEITDMASYYDDMPRNIPGKYWWRVRAVDPEGKTIGVYSDAQEMIVPQSEPLLLAAAFGDSITHGGGALSYSPADQEYSYETYLEFPAVNLGRSGDTATMSADRFEQDVVPFHPLNLLILCGSNDLRDGSISAADTIAALKRIQEACERNHIHPIFLTLMPIHPENIYQAFHTETDESWREKLNVINAYIRTQPDYIDLEPYFYNSSGLLATKYATDGLHGDIRGKKLMAYIINEHQDLLIHP